MNKIGGYFELDLRKGAEYHQGAIRLNSGRNAFEYILLAKKYKKVYLPSYICEVMLEPIDKLNLAYEFYNINEQLEPVFNYNRIGEDETFLYTNYFGIKGQLLKKLSIECRNLIIDNSQAFFESPIPQIDTFYSPRKFFGVPDGAYLFTNQLLKIQLLHDKSFSRFSHLIKRIDEGAEEGYDDFKTNDTSLNGQPIKKMSKLTQALLCNIDYSKAIKIRKRNFQFLHEHLQYSNELILNEVYDYKPMVYPYLTAKGNILKQKLIQNKIFIATYWSNSENWGNKNLYEEYLFQNLLPIPIDQRYTIKAIKTVLELINHYE